MYGPSQIDIPDPGVLYVMTNAHMPGLCKIGMTSGDVQERARQLSTTGVPGRFDIAWSSRPLANVRKAELAAHRALSVYLIPGGEFFRIGVDEALHQLQDIEEKYLDVAWEAEERQRRFWSRLEREEQARRLVAARREHACLLEEVDDWIRQPTIQRAFAEAARHPTPFATTMDSPFAGCLYVAGFGVLFLVTLPLLEGLAPLLSALVFFGLVLWLMNLWKSSDATRSERAARRRKEIWSRVASLTPAGVWKELEAARWEVGSPEEFRAEIESRAP